MKVFARPDPSDLAIHLLRNSGFAAESATAVPLPGGRNNRVFRVTAPNETYLLKCYFHHPQDPRDRLGQEIAFLHHLTRVGCRMAPAAFASEPSRHCALLEFIVGEPLQPAEIDESKIDQAADFFHQANVDLDSNATRTIPVASEACFSIAEHVATVQRRVDRLADIPETDEIEAAARVFVQQEMIPVWREVQAAILARWPTAEDRTCDLPVSERCLSPSDFGFHNALRETTGRIRFLDFEYAGWDDPAKLVCDFANQPDLLLPRSLSDRFHSAVLAANPNPEALARRVAALEPLYQVKWACICLNEFLTISRSRRQFASGESGDLFARRQTQLVRARQMMDRIASPLSAVLTA